MVSNTEITIIRPRPTWSVKELQELWSHRELLTVFAERDIKVRYKQTVIGILWALIQPLSTMLIFTVMFSRFSSNQSIPYPLFSYVGLLLWTYFSAAIAASSASLLGNSSLITKVYFPRLIIPLSAVLVGLIDLGIACLLLFFLLAWYGVAVTWTTLLSLTSIAGVVAFTIGLGSWLAAINVKYHDVKYAIPFFLSLGIFVTPVIYPLSDAPRLHLLLSLNPMTGFIESFRSFILGSPFDPTSYLLAWVVTFIFLVGGLRYFRSVERYFSDLL